MIQTENNDIHIAIIGGGPVGVITALNLIRHYSPENTAPLHVHIVDPHGFGHGGTAFGLKIMAGTKKENAEFEAAQKRLLLNTPAQTMNLDFLGLPAPHPQAFDLFARQHLPENISPYNIYPRYVYGDYMRYVAGFLNDYISNAQAKDPALQRTGQFYIHEHHMVATAAHKKNNSFVLTLNDAESSPVEENKKILRMDAIILATGHQPNNRFKLPSQKRGAFLTPLGAYNSDHWQVSEYCAYDVVLIGQGPSTIDALHALNFSNRGITDRKILVIGHTVNYDIQKYHSQNCEVMYLLDNKMIDFNAGFVTAVHKNGGAYEITCRENKIERTITTANIINCSPWRMTWGEHRLKNPLLDNMHTNNLLTVSETNPDSLLYNKNTGQTSENVFLASPVLRSPYGDDWMLKLQLPFLNQMAMNILLSTGLELQFPKLLPCPDTHHRRRPDGGCTPTS